jgi:3-oxoacyl-[acyl-carrier-protein] synthase II
MVGIFTRTNKRRVVITGMGSVNPLGLNVEETWQKLIDSQSGIKKITYFETDSYPVKIAGELSNFNAEDYIPPKDVKKMDRFIQYAIAASKEAVEHSKIDIKNEELLSRVGVIIGSGIGGLKTIEDTSRTFYSENKRITPFFIPASLVNLASGNVSMMYGFAGPNHAVSTACSTGNHAIGDAARLISYGDADVMIAGSAEASITPLGIGGFAALRALTTKFNDTPEVSSRPWDKNRSGFVMSEGAGILVLEEYEHAKKRDADIYAEVLGYGLSGDAYHITAPHPEGRGAKNAMQKALQDASLSPEDIDYINAHATSTGLGDSAELNAVSSIFKNNIMMSSTKSSVGHMLGASASLEAIFCALSIKNSIVPPTINLDNPDIGDLKIDLVPKYARKKKLNKVLSNSFGFGGTNTSLILGSI